MEKRLPTLTETTEANLTHHFRDGEYTYSICTVCRFIGDQHHACKGGCCAPTMADLAVGDRVRVWARQAERLATVTAKARTRVTVAFTLKSGAKRESKVKPTDCRKVAQ